MLGLPGRSVTEVTETESFSRSFHEVFLSEVEQSVLQAVLHYKGGIIVMLQQTERMFPRREKGMVRQF